MKKNIRKYAVGLLVLVLSLSLFAGCAVNPEVIESKVSSAVSKASEIDIGESLLGGEPEIDVDYGKNGLVVEIERDEPEIRVSEADRKAQKHSASESEVKAPKSSAAEEKELLSLEEAKNIALSHFDLKDAVLKDYDYDHDEQKYEFEFLSEGIEYSADVSAVSGKVYDADYEREGPKPGASKPEVKVPDADASEEKELLSLEKAKKIALSHFGLKDAVLKDYDYDHDEQKYEFEFLSEGIEYSADVSAVSGKVFDADYERDDDSYFD